MNRRARLYWKDWVSRCLKTLQSKSAVFIVNSNYRHEDFDADVDEAFNGLKNEMQKVDLFDADEMTREKFLADIIACNEVFASLF